MHGMSTRSVDDLVTARGGSGISKSEVSRICAGLDETVGAFRTRRLDHVEFPYVFLDATYLHVRTEHGMVASKAAISSAPGHGPRMRCAWPPSAGGHAVRLPEDRWCRAADLARRLRRGRRAVAAGPGRQPWLVSPGCASSSLWLTYSGDAAAPRRRWPSSTCWRRPGSRGFVPRHARLARTSSLTAAGCNGGRDGRLHPHLDGRGRPRGSTGTARCSSPAGCERRGVDE